MREILFRGKRIDNGEWVEGFYCQRKEKILGGIKTRHMILVPDADSYSGARWIDVNPTTVGQCVPGLTDKNGKKIFEGDIVDITQYDNVYHKAYRCCRSKVFFSNFAFRTNAAPEYEDEEPLSYWFWHDCEFEVIGNIHDNPELLEDKL